jgi:hypothetical protein
MKLTHPSADSADDLSFEVKRVTSDFCNGPVASDDLLVRRCVVSQQHEDGHDHLPVSSISRKSYMLGDTCGVAIGDLSSFKHLHEPQLTSATVILCLFAASRSMWLYAVSWCH